MMNESEIIKQLRESEEKWRSLVELAPDGIVTMNMKGVITSINSAFTRLTGYSSEEVVGKHCRLPRTSGEIRLDKRSRCSGFPSLLFTISSRS